VGGHAVAVQVAVVVVVVADDVAVAQRREHKLRAERVAEQVGQILHCDQQLVRLDGCVRTRIPATRKATVLLTLSLNLSGRECFGENVLAMRAPDDSSGFHSIGLEISINLLQ